MGLENFYEVKTWIKFGILGLLFVWFVFSFAPSLKWKIVLSLGGLIGLAIALSGSSLRRRN